MNILAVEDDKTIGAGLSYALEQEGFSVSLHETVASARAAIAGEALDLCILDLTLPDGSGYELCRQVKEKGDIPVIFLTACDDEVNVVMGLDMGADDYITKPFRIRELVSRINSVLRRYKKSGKEDRGLLRLGNVSIHTQEAKVLRQGREVELTALEYRLLLTFANHKNQILTRNQLLEILWDTTGDFVNDNTLTVYIKRLRDKLEKDPQNPQLIKTVRGFGYRAED